MQSNGKDEAAAALESAVASDLPWRANTRFTADALQEFARVDPRRTHRSSLARLSAQIQHLCMLNIESHMLMPVLLRTLRRLTEADYAVFCWASADYKSADICMDPVIPEIVAAVPEYTTTHEAFRRHTRDAHGVDFETSMRRGHGWGNTARHDRMFVRSLEYQLLWRPARIRHGLESTVVQKDRGWGALNFARADGAAPFNERNEELLAPLSAFIAHAVLNPARADSFAPQPTEHGLLLVDRASRILWQSPQGIRLLRQADGRSSLFESRRNTVPDWLRQVVHVLSQTDGTCAVSMPPLIHRRTQWGTFTLRAYPLVECEPALRSASSFAIQIERHEPLVLQVARGAHRLGMTRRQTEICTHLARGLSDTQVARRMSVRPASVIDQIRKMYTRFDVHDRNSLLRLVSGAALSLSAEMPSVRKG